MTRPQPGDRYRLTSGSEITILSVTADVIRVRGPWDQYPRWWWGDDWQIHLDGAVKL